MHQLEDFNELDENILREVVREGEVLLSSQFQSALNADQRAMAWVSIVATLATAAFGASAWLALMQAPAIYLAVLFLFASSLAMSGYIGSLAVRPGKFQLPGNEPKNWLYWESRPKIKQGLIEQAKVLDLQAEVNRVALEKSAKVLRISIDLFFISIALLFVSSAVLYLFVYLGKIIPPSVLPPAA